VAGTSALEEKKKTKKNNNKKKKDDLADRLLSGCSDCSAVGPRAPASYYVHIIILYRQIPILYCTYIYYVQIYDRYIRKLGTCKNTRFVGGVVRLCKSI